jgi:hypothetical protein
MVTRPPSSITDAVRRFITSDQYAEFLNAFQEQRATIWFMRLDHDAVAEMQSGTESQPQIIVDPYAHLDDPDAIPTTIIHEHLHAWIDNCVDDYGVRQFPQDEDIVESSARRIAMGEDPKRVQSSMKRRLSTVASRRSHV